VEYLIQLFISRFFILLNFLKGIQFRGIGEFSEDKESFIIIP
jgi:hypothetical protein